ncbi:glutathione S-transferase family protein [Phenylobacterium deserti]|uniref:glutathione transferase n=1 Tax=Phenylobacterium deserti TaxID=1914756 RepID=A0A328ANH8_9CAUL|nr:glutathione S-transferase [Phenylobacterium deserti]RAK56572.1 glutathione S-transferase [Phenylobacterium deserti]
MLTVHHLNNSRSQRVLWLLEELGVPYEVVRYERDPKTMLAPAALKAVHPLGKSPVVTVDGETIAETGAILEFILERYGQGRLAPPAGTPEARQMRYWLHYAEGSAMSPLLLKLVFSRMSGRAPGLLKPLVGSIASRAQVEVVDPQLKAHFDYWEAELSKTGWFAGPAFSAADVMMSFPVEAAAARGGALEGRPRLTQFLKTIHARPAYQRALERGGPYAYA